jgi:hypothetical protein
MVEVIDRLEAEGYTTQFAAREGGTIQCLTCRDSFAPDEAGTAELRRVEGASDPADMAAIGAVTCPRCDARGTLVLKFGPDATPEEDDALRALQDHR